MTMRLIRLMMLLSAPALVAAAPPPPASAAPAAPPGNSVRCVYEFLTPEDREIALLLLSREMAGSGRFRATSRNVRAINRLIEEAHGKCLDRYNWSFGRSDAALGYAMTAILSDAVMQSLDGFGQPVDRIDRYYAENRTALSNRKELDEADRQRLADYLKENGWKAGEKGELELAALYLESLLLRDAAQRQFMASGGTGRQPIRSTRPAKARPGKP